MKVHIDDPTWDEATGRRKPPPSKRYEIVLTAEVTKKQRGEVTDSSGKKSTALFEVTETEVLQRIKVSPILEKYSITAAIVAYFVLVISGFLFLGVPMAGSGGLVSYGEVLMVLPLLHIAVSIHSVNENEFGALFFWGQPVRDVDQGLRFVPFGLLSLQRLPRNPIQWQFPDDPEYVFKGTDSERANDEEFFALSPEERGSFSLPIRVTTGKPKKSTKDKTPDGNEDVAALDVQMTIEVNFYVRWRVQHPIVFLVRIGSIGEALRQLRDSGERTVTNEIVKRTPAAIISGLNTINKKLNDELENITGDWAISVIEAAMLSPDLTYKVNKALQAVPEAKARATQTQVTAQAERIRLTQEGQGRAAALTAEYAAIADGAKNLGVNAEELIALRKTEAVAKGNATIFIDGGNTSSSLFGFGAKFAAGGSQVLDQQRSDASDGTAEPDTRKE